MRENRLGPERDARDQPQARSDSTPPAAGVFSVGADRQRQVLQLLERGTEALLTSEGYQAYLKTMARFHRYSFANSLLIHAQHPDATRVAGYRAWRSLGRQVRKGERAIKIFVPFRKKREDAETGEECCYVTGFGLGNVFDVSSTDGEPLPERAPLIESTEVTDVSREVNKRLSRWGIDEGIIMESRELHGHAHGLWNPRNRQIVIRRGTNIDENGEEYPLVDPLNIGKTKTLAHELAHYIADHKNGDDRRDAEVVAESAAFVALEHFGLHTENYTFGYVAGWAGWAGWAGDMGRVRANLGEVQRVAAILITAIEGVSDPADDKLGSMARTDESDVSY